MFETNKLDFLCFAIASKSARGNLNSCWWKHGSLLPSSSQFLTNPIHGKTAVGDSLHY